MNESYEILEAAGASADAPLIFLFHGTGGNEQQFFDLAEQLLPGAHRVAIRGDVSEHGALRYFKRQGEGVYDMADLALRTTKMAAFLKAKIAAIAPSKSMAFGYSNGANIIASVLFEAPELLHRCVLLHPLIPFAPAPQPALSGKEILITAGKVDPLCPPDLTQQLTDYFKAQGANAELFWHAGGHDLRQEELRAAAQFLRQGPSGP